jgi:GNAT superfamily N-acetyltransferase
VRLAGDADLETVTRLRVAFVEEDDPRGATTGAELRAATRRYVDAAHGDGSLVSWLAEDGDEVVGIVSMLVGHAPPRASDPTTKQAYVVNMYVEPSHRRRGIAQALLDAMVAEAQARGLRVLHLYATELGRPLYERNGFVVNDAWMELPL